MQILQTVIVKQVLTESTKENLLEKYKQTLVQLEKECQQLRFEEKKQSRNQQLSTNKIKSYYNSEMKKRLEKQKDIEFLIDQIHILPLGSELKEQEVTALVEINEGDVWHDAISSKTIIVKDGVVEEIR
ncbi:YlqD family protein [Niallia sp. 01092]|uniref:YlqD family protein n=1 Tax=unclassified Niallia TaxID=2837522 RepID=UPI003FD4026F